jgi:FHS family L-fucose permease-like MFS transporter
MEEIRSLGAPELYAYRVHEAASVKLPYLGIGITLLLLAFLLSLTRLPKVATVESDVTPESSNRSIWSFRHLVLGSLGIFVYVGAEVAIGSFLVSYFLQPDIGAMTVKAAAGYVSLYWGGAMVGRFIGSALLQKIRTEYLLAVFASVACFLVILSMLSSGHIAMWSIIAIGLFNSIMFPSIFTLGISGLGPLTGKGSGLLIAAIVGGAIIPEIQGIIADHIGIHHAFFVPAICYAYIVYFAIVCARTPSAPQLPEPAVHQSLEV